MALPPILAKLKYEVMCLRQELDGIKDRLSVVEEQSCANRNMIDEANELIEIIDERLDEEL